MATVIATSGMKGSAGESYGLAKKAAEKALKDLGRKADLAVVYCDVSYDAREVVRAVREVTGAPLAGCTSYGEFTERGNETGSIAISLISSDDMKFFSAMAKGLKEDSEAAAEELKRSLPSKVEGFPDLYGLIYLDGLTGRGEEISLSISMGFDGIPLIGGGAADMSGRESFVFSDDAVASDAVVLCIIASRKPLGMGVAHGMSVKFGPLKVTKAKENVVFELNGKAAWEVWKAVVAEDAKKTFGIDTSRLGMGLEDLASILVNYLPAIRLDGSIYKIRAVFSVTEDGAMVFMCGVPQESELYVMGYTRENMIESAGIAAEAANKSIGGKVSGVLIIDCAAREMILGKDFPEALNEFRRVFRVPIFGFGAMGEIYMARGQFSGFHNATSVVLALPE